MADFELHMKRGQWQIYDESSHAKAVQMLRESATDKHSVIAKHGYAWRIVRTTDNVVLAQSKSAPDSDPTVADAPMDTPATVSVSEPESGMVEFEDHTSFQEYMGIERKEGIALPNLWAKLLDIAAEEDIYPAPDVISLDSEPVASDPYPAGSIVEVCGVRHEVQENGVFKQLPPVAPKTGIQWLTRDDFRYEEKIGNPYSKSIYSHTWGDWYFRDFHNGAYSKKSRRNSSVQAKKVTLPNMQKKSRQIANKDDKRELPRETILQIVSRIQTPLTGGARRVA